MPAGTVVSRGYLAPRAVDGMRGRGRATFARCAYLTVDGGPALVLHADGRDRTPTSLCPASWPSAAVAAGDLVVGRAGHLKIGELVLDTRGAREWRPPAPPGPTASLGDAGIATSAHRIALRAADRRTGGLLPALEHALARADARSIATCVASLVGRGPGLTPSGDDALVGLLAALHRLAPRGEGPPAQPPGRAVEAALRCGEAAPARRLRPAVLEHLERTGDISAHYLRLAAGGHVGERLVALCDALARGGPREIDAAAAAVVATGATSGADALLGVLAGVRLVSASGAGGTAVAA